MTLFNNKITFECSDFHKEFIDKLIDHSKNDLNNVLSDLIYFYILVHKLSPSKIRLLVGSHLYNKYFRGFHEREQKTDEI